MKKYGDVSRKFVGSIWKENSMHNSRYGLVLRTSGAMGDQGSSTHYSSEVYETNISSAQTLSDNSNPGITPTSKLYSTSASCGSSATALPCTNYSVNAFAVPYSSPSTLIAISGGSAAYTCPSSGGGGTDVVVGGAMASPSGTTSSTPSTAALQSIIANTGSLPVYNYETRWASQYYVNSIDATVAAASAYAGAKAIAAIDAQAAQANYTQAQSLNNSFSPNNTIETNWKSVNTISFKQALRKTYTLNTADISTLKAIAAQCPLSGGSVVFRARTILNGYYRMVLEYPGDCSNAGSGARAANTEGIETEGGITNNNIRLYPNPNNGSMMLEYSIKGDARLLISDFTGNLVGAYDMPATENSIEVKNNYLQNGVYMYRIISNDILIKVGKIVVMQ